MILIADLGATNARFCVTHNCLSFSNEASYKIKDFDSLANLCNSYIYDQGLKKIDKSLLPDYLYNNLDKYKDWLD